MDRDWRTNLRGVSLVTRLGMLHSGDHRGQTAVDFAFGIGVFLLALVFIFMFLPDLIAPFDTPGEDGDKIQAERTADLLVEQTLTADQENSEEATLTPKCVDAFFAENTNPPPTCGFPGGVFDSGDLDPTALGLESSTRVHVRLESLDGDDVRQVGPSVPTSQNVQEWTRIVSVSGSAFTLRVQVW